MRWASAISRRPGLDEALSDAVEQAARALDQIEPDLVFVFLDVRHVAHAARVAARLAPWLGSGLLVGVSAQGVAGGGREVEGEAAVALLAAVLPDVDIEARHVDQASLAVGAADAVAWRALLGTELDDPCFVVLADPYTIETGTLVRGLDVAHPEAGKVGALASGARRAGGHALLLGPDVYRSGAVVLALGGNVRLDAVVAQGCRAVGEPHFVTGCHEHLLRELDGRSPRDVLTDLYERLPPADRTLFGSGLHLGLALPAAEPGLAPREFLVRNLLGLDPDTGALWIGAELEPNSVVQFHLRDATSAARDLERRLAYARAAPFAADAAGALLFTCVGRGAGLYGAPDHDTRAFQRAFPDVPLAGCFAGGEIGPLGGATRVHGHTCVLGVFGPRRSRGR